MQKKGASMEEYKAFSAEQVEDFTQEEMDAADRVFGEMEKTLEENGYTLPPLDEIVLIKTTMKEEPGAAAYTHGTQIYLSAYVLETYLSDTADEATARYARHIFWHELFHCLTRQRTLTRYSGPTQAMSSIPKSAWRIIPGTPWPMAWTDREGSAIRIPRSLKVYIRSLKADRTDCGTEGTRRGDTAPNCVRQTETKEVTT